MGSLVIETSLLLCIIADRAEYNITSNKENRKFAKEIPDAFWYHVDLNTPFIQSAPEFIQSQASGDGEACSPVQSTTSAPPHIVRKMRGRTALKSVLGRVLNPVQLWRAGSLQWHRKANRRSLDDQRLALYARILPGDFLHYGYFDDTDHPPAEMSLADLTRAQTRYAELLLELIGEPKGPVLDVGCGMGGLTRMLQARGYEAVALTPDRLQAAYVAKEVPAATVIRCKFEAIPVASHTHRYDAVVTAESLQYLKLDAALEVMGQILKPGGVWVACDYFLTQPSGDHTCHDWETFLQKLDSTGWHLTSQRDITAHVMPTLAFIHMLATRFGLGMMDFATLRLRRKQPGLHHLLAGVHGQLKDVIDDNIRLIDPAHFALDRRYMLLKIERKPG